MENRLCFVVTEREFGKGKGCVCRREIRLSLGGSAGGEGAWVSSLWLIILMGSVAHGGLCPPQADSIHNIL